MSKISQLRKKFFKWRYKHLSNQQFIYLLSILVGFLSGLGTVAIKNLTHFIQSGLKVKFIREYHLTFYFVFPIIGLVLVYMIQKYVFKRKISHAIPSTLFALSKRKGLIDGPCGPRRVHNTQTAAAAVRRLGSHCFMTCAMRQSIIT